MQNDKITVLCNKVFTFLDKRQEDEIFRNNFEPYRFLLSENFKAQPQVYL